MGITFLKFFWIQWRSRSAGYWRSHKKPADQDSHCFHPHNESIFMIKCTTWQWQTVKSGVNKLKCIKEYSALCVLIEAEWVLLLDQILLYSIGFKYGCSYINIYQVPKGDVKNLSRGTWQTLMYWKIMFNRYYYSKTSKKWTPIFRNTR